MTLDGLSDASDVRSLARLDFGPCHISASVRAAFYADHQVATIDLTGGKSVGHVSEQVSAISRSKHLTRQSIKTE
ncbi:MAG: hypothetical protein QOI93_5852 [Rhodospirillaceae bacterium]|jgi:hypothetical protein|nr:hypothetical protein [Rhodospirillaceae bacterium]